MTESQLSEKEIARIISATHDNPRSVLGFHEVGTGKKKRWIVRVFEPGAISASVVWEGQKKASKMRCLHEDGLFELMTKAKETVRPYKISAKFSDGNQYLRHDPYYFAPEIGELDRYLFAAGNHQHIYRKLGAHQCEQQGVSGTLFALWAPNATRVSVVGDFNLWDGRRHSMIAHRESGIWQLFVPDIGEGQTYKYEIRDFKDQVHLKADPYAFQAQRRPDNCSVVTNLDGYAWGDQEWMEKRRLSDPLVAAINIYEVHPGSWKRIDGGFFNWDQLAQELITYVVDMGYTHIELMGLAEHPLDRSWGYQVTGYYAVTSRFGHPKGFMAFVDRCHAAGIGVIMDWVPGHFPRDDFGLARFDGSCLYEHEDQRKGEHIEWGTNVFNFGRNEVRNFLTANALFWLEYYHIDGLRVDAVAAMIYLDYNRKEGEWEPNESGGRENVEAIRFLQQLNQNIFRNFPGVLSIAEESTAFPGVSHPVEKGGLGFNFKWNMGWMNDSLRYISMDPVHRKYESALVTFAMVYAWSENFVLPISHDEVVYGKKSLLDKMPGDEWQKRANYRAYLAFMQTHPGKKLLFMGQEFGQYAEWNEDQSLDWHLLDYPDHKRLQVFCRDLNHFYQQNPQLYLADTRPEGFEWIECKDDAQSVFAFLRRDGRNALPPLLCIVNFTPVPRENYRLGVPVAGRWEKVFDSDAAHYGGSGSVEQFSVSSRPVASHQQRQSAAFQLPPLSVTVWSPTSQG